MSDAIIGRVLVFLALTATIFMIVSMFLRGGR